jgi:HAD superfamily hydrolase (TIGR01549 family)
VKGRLNVVKRPKALLLDFDDTLLDDSVVPESVARTCNAIAEAVAALDAEELLRANTTAWTSYWPEAEHRCWIGDLEIFDVSREVWRRALQTCGHNDASLVDLAYETHQEIGRTMSRLFDDVPDLLETLTTAKLPTGLVTNSSPKAQQAMLQTVGLESTFDVVVISGEVRVAKPDAAIFEVALERLDVEPAMVWHVGDSLSTDIAGAAAAGIPSVWLNRTDRRLAPSDPCPDHEIGSLRDLVQMLRP